MVWVKLIDMGYQSALPDKAESIVPWIRPIAEKEYKYAMKGGRPRKPLTVTDTPFSVTGGQF